MQTAPALNLDSYQLHLPTFEGPLDVLLRLIEREQLAISDVSLVAVTDQFLAHLAALTERPPAVIAEFAAVAARLVLLKSRSLLPRPPVEAAEPAVDDLVHQLAEYQALKQAAQVFATWDRSARGGYDRGGAIVLPAAPAPRLAIHPPQSLTRALRRRLTAARPPVQALTTRRVVSLRAMSERLLALALRGPASFQTLRASCADREEVLVSFLALLVLVRRQVVDASQPETFGEIRYVRLADAALTAEPTEFEPTA